MRLEYDRIITRVDPDIILAAIDGMGADGTLAIRTDLNRRDCIAIERALGRSWRIRFRRAGDVIWTCNSSLMVNVIEHPLDHYAGMLERGETFSFLRYGDMLACVADTLYPGYGFQVFTPELRADMLRSLVEYYRDSHYLMALAPVYHFRRMGLWGHVARFLRDNHLDDIGWVGTEVFNRAMMRGELWPFIRALRSADTLVVGPEKLAALGESVLPDAEFLSIPDRGCHAQMDEMVEAVLVRRSPAVITVSAGPAAVVLIHRLFPSIGDRTTMISVGSLWGPFIGRPEHGDQCKLRGETMQRNLGAV